MNIRYLGYLSTNIPEGMFEPVGQLEESMEKFLCRWPARVSTFERMEGLEWKSMIGGFYGFSEAGSPCASDSTVLSLTENSEY